MDKVPSRELSQELAQELFVEVAPEVERDAALYLPVEEQIQGAEYVRLPAPIRPDDGDDVVEGREFDRC